VPASRLCFDPAFKLACGRLPDSGLDLCSQPTMSRWENAPNLREVIGLMGVMIDLYCASYHKGQIASDRTSCRSTLANQMRLILHTAAYWHALAKAEFATIRLRLGDVCGRSP
jgi:hypothetical protein